MPGTNRRLTLDDIEDLRAYERHRADAIARIIALKKRRRAHVGPFATLLFDNRETVLSQIHEMARAERILTDEGLQGQLDTYNPLIPEPGSLSATLMLELTEDSQVREWLPKLVGIESHVVFRFDGEEIRSRVEPAHGRQLTREDVTAAVHFIGFEFTPKQVDAWGSGTAVLAVDHPAYSHELTLGEEMVDELAKDLRD